MILQCPECSARFAVPDALIPPQGRIVKCGRCTHQWHADGAADILDFAAMATAEAEQAALRPVNPSRLPVPQRKPMRSQPFILAALLLLMGWLLLAFIGYYPRWLPVAGPRAVYHALGIDTTQGLVFADVSMQRSNDGAKTQFLLTGSIANQAADSRTVPTVRVELKDSQGKILWSRKYAVNEPLEPGQVYPFRIDNVETSFAASVSTITLDLGHKLQLLVR